jgi:hypothetical protein
MKSVIENIRRIRNLMILEDKFTTDIDLAMYGDTQEPIQKGPGTNDGDNEAPDGMDESELSEDDAAPAGDSGGSSASYPTLNKWASGRAEGPGNSVGNTKWEDTVGSKLTRGPGNKKNKSGERVWASGRQFGPTGNNYKA